MVDGESIVSYEAPCSNNCVEAEANARLDARIRWSKRYVHPLPRYTNTILLHTTANNENLQQYPLPITDQTRPSLL